MSQSDDSNAGDEGLPPPPPSDPVAGVAPRPSLPPPPADGPTPANKGSAVGGGCLTAVGGVALILSLIMFSAASDANSVTTDTAGLAPFIGGLLSGLAVVMLGIGVILLVIGVVILKRVDR